MELVGKGAEANLYRDGGTLVKERAGKAYRIPELDKTIRRRRTKSEAKIMQKARQAGILTPKILDTGKDSYKITMEYVDGVLCKDVLGQSDDARIATLSARIGGDLRKLHDADIIHNDLTTSNLIIAGEDPYFIDFGLAFRSKRLEDKAMDLVVFKKSLMATHTTLVEPIWAAVVAGYLPDKDILARVEQIEKRVRYS
ncbi:KEOPS complex kinase/ATPase Bud32 [Candidatus Altiarchaeota archaeon]